MIRRGGFILLAVSMVLAVLAVLTYSLGKMGGLSARTETRAVDAERARLLAEAGLAHALRNMQIPTAAAMTGPTACAFNDSFTLGAAGTTTTYLSGGIGGVGTYTVSFIRQSADTANGARPLLLEAIGTLANGALHRQRLALPTESFALAGWSTSRSIAARGPATEDTYIKSSSPWNNYYWTDDLEIDGPIGSSEERILLRFALGHFPGLASNSRAIYVRMGLYQNQAASGSTSLSAHLITENWNVDDASWNKRTSSSWSTSGGTHNATALGSMAYISGTGMRWMELDTSIVSNWQVANRGLLIKASGSADYKFNSLNYDEWTDNDATFQMRVPKLEIVYLKGC